MGLVHLICSSSKEFSIRAGQGSSTPGLRKEQDSCVSVDGHRVLREQWTHKFLRTCEKHAPTLRRELGSTVTSVQTGAQSRLLCFAAGVDEAPRPAHYSHTAGCHGPSPIHDPSAAEWNGCCRRLSSKTLSSIAARCSDPSKALSSNLQKLLSRA